MSAIAWSSVKTAIHSWFVLGSGLAADRVLFRGQNIARPSGAGAFISLRFVSIETIGRPTVRREENPSPSAGAEMLRKTASHARVVYEATCFPPAPPDDGSCVPDASEAHATLHEVTQVAELFATKKALSSANIGMLRFNTILPLDGVVGSTRFEPRAILTFSFMVPSLLVETITNIETVNVEIETADPARTFTFTRDIDP